MEVYLQQHGPQVEKRVAQMEGVTSTLEGEPKAFYAPKRLGIGRPNKARTAGPLELLPSPINGPEP